MGQEWRAKEIYLAAAPVSEGMVGSTFYSTLVVCFLQVVFKGIEFSRWTKAVGIQVKDDIDLWHGLE